MYDEALKNGFKPSSGVTGQYYPSSDNYKEFYKVYSVMKGNEVEALLQTPAGKVSAQAGMKPTQIKIGLDKIEVIWIKE
jgi:hypothetical protein